MFTILDMNIMAAVGIFIYYSCIYIVVSQIIYKIKNSHADSVNNISLTYISEPALQAEPILQTELINMSNPTEVVKSEYTEIPYKHELWPSPRPVNFVRAIIEEEPDCNLIYHNRLTHQAAVDILAHRANMTRTEFLKTNPLTYSERYMKGMNALYLLKGSIDRLEDLLRSETRRQHFHLVDGRTVYPRFN